MVIYSIIRVNEPQVMSFIIMLKRKIMSINYYSSLQEKDEGCDINGINQHQTRKS